MGLSRPDLARHATAPSALNGRRDEMRRMIRMGFAETRAGRGPNNDLLEALSIMLIVPCPRVSRDSTWDTAGEAIQGEGEQQ